MRSIADVRHGHKLVSELQKRRSREANGKGRHFEDRRTTVVYAIHTAVAERKESQLVEDPSLVLKTSWTLKIRDCRAIGDRFVQIGV